MHRFFVNKKNIDKEQIFITGEDVKHIKNVLRFNKGDKIVVCDGEKRDYIVEITLMDKNKVVGRIIEEKKSSGEFPIEIILYQGIPKSNKMDLIIQKAVELGVHRIVPVITERTVVKIKEKNKELKKIDRWNRISLESAKQCRRGIIPIVDNIKTFSEMMQNLTNETFILVPYESEKKMGLKDVFKKYKSERVNIVIGPEGGFEEEEINNLKSIGANIITLGPRILRTETAGFTTIAITMYELGDLGVVE